jgi:hypothetical protein
VCPLQHYERRKKQCSLDIIIELLVFISNLIVKKAINEGDQRNEDPKTIATITDPITPTTPPPTETFAPTLAPLEGEGVNVTVTVPPKSLVPVVVVVSVAVALAVVLPVFVPFAPVGLGKENELVPENVLEEEPAASVRFAFDDGGAHEGVPFVSTKQVSPAAVSINHSSRKAKS